MDNEAGERCAPTSQQLRDPERPTGETSSGETSGDAADETDGPELSDRPAGRHGLATRFALLGATALFFASCLSFLLNTPVGIGPDELYQFDRVIAASHGQVILDPEEINMSKGVRAIERTYIKTQMRRGAPSWAEYLPLMRDERPSLAELGGNARSFERDVSNYMTQHPPLYYGLLGAATWLIPGAEDIPADTLFLLVRAMNVLLLLPLPLLFWYGAVQLVGRGPVASAAAFLPLLVPGLARVSSTVNNDNLAILVGAAVVALCLKVMRGDRSVRTAAFLAGLAIAGSLTKATVLFILPIILLAYAVQAIRARSWPPVRVLGVLILGALGASFWWLRNLIRFGVVQPDAWGTQFARAQGSPRAPDVPMDMDYYWRIIGLAPSRFFGALGLHEPPQLPPTMVRILTIVLLVALAVALIVLRGRRPELLVTFLVPAASLVMISYQAYLHFVSYMAIPGIQGRYVYPAVFGLLFPVAVTAGVILGPARKWAPALVAAVGLLVSGWAVYISAEYTWLHRGEQLQPSNWLRAFETMGGFFPLPGALTATLAVLIAGLLVAGAVLTMLSCVRTRTGDSDGERVLEAPARPPVYS